MSLGESVVPISATVCLSFYRDTSTKPAQVTNPIGKIILAIGDELIAGKALRDRRKPYI